MRCALVLLLAGPVLAQDAPKAPDSRAALAQLKEGDELLAKGNLDGAIAAYRNVVAMFREAQKKEDGKAAEGKGPAPEPAPTDDGTPEGKKRVVDYYVKLLDDQSDDVRYNAVATLGEMRAVEAKDALLAVLEKDKYQLARRAAAWALGRLGKEGAPAIPALIREVGGEFPLLAYMCDDAISDITESMGERVSMGFENGMTAAQRLEIQKKWHEWLERNREKLGIPAAPPAEKPPEAEKPAERPPEPRREEKD
jgi:hypothetical protein